MKIIVNIEALVLPPSVDPRGLGAELERALARRLRERRGQEDTSRETGPSRRAEGTGGPIADVVMSKLDR